MKERKPRRGQGGLQGDNQGGLQLVMSSCVIRAWPITAPLLAAAAPLAGTPSTAAPPVVGDDPRSKPRAKVASVVSRWGEEDSRTDG